MHSSWQVQRVARVVRQGGVIAYPTEAVWGLGCDPWDELAVGRLLALKDRPVHKGPDPGGGQHPAVRLPTR